MDNSHEGFLAIIGLFVMGIRRGIFAEKWRVWHGYGSFMRLYETVGIDVLVLVVL